MLHKVLKYLFFTKYNKTFKSARNIKNSKTMGKRYFAHDLHYSFKRRTIL